MLNPNLIGGNLHDCLYYQCPLHLKQNLVALIDWACPQCFWRRKFIIEWRDKGLNYAYASWLAKAPKQNPEFLPKIDLAVEEIRTWRSKPSTT